MTDKPNPFHVIRSARVDDDRSPPGSVAAEHLRHHAGAASNREEQLRFQSTHRVERRGSGQQHYWIRPDVAAATEVEYPSHFNPKE